MNYLHYRLSSDYESHNQFYENFETETPSANTSSTKKPSANTSSSKKKPSIDDKGVITFTKNDMTSIFQSGNSHVFDSSSNLYLAEYAFQVKVDNLLLYIHGEGYYPKDTRGTMGETMMRQRYTLCQVSGNGPFKSSVLASSFFILAGSEGYPAEGTYSNRRKSLTVKNNGEISVDFGSIRS